MHTQFSSSRRSPAGALIFLRLLLVIAAACVPRVQNARAQCVTEWLPGFPTPTITTTTTNPVPITALATYDPDGSGPGPERLAVGGLFTALEGFECRNLAVWDGQRWTATPALPPGVSVRALAYYNGNLVVGGATLLQCIDGSSWTSLGTPSSGGVISIAEHAGQLFVAGSFGSIDGVASTTGIAMWDGVTWHSIGGLNGSGLALLSTPLGLVVVGDFSAAGGVSTIDAALWNGTNWQAMPGLPTSTSQAITVASFENSTHVGLTSPDGVVAHYRWNGTTLVPTNLTGQVSSLVAHGGELIAFGRHLAINGVYAPINAARWDGTTWNPVSNPQNFVDNTSYQLGPAIVYDNRVVVGGDPRYKPDASTSTYRRALLELELPSNWSTFAKGVDGPVSDFEEFEGSVVLAGSFRMAGGKPTLGLARFDGTRVAPMSDGLTRDAALPLGATDLQVFNGELFVCGSGFKGFGFNNVSKWNGTAWTGFGAPTFPGQLFALEVHNGSIFVAGTGPVLRLGSTGWQSVGTASPIGPNIDLVSHDGTLYSSGPRRWNGANLWSMVPVGASTVHKFFSHGADLYAYAPLGFYNSQDGSRSAVGILRPQGVEPLGQLGSWAGPSLSGSFEEYHGDIIIAHTFSTGRVLRYDGITWTPLPGDVHGAIVEDTNSPRAFGGKRIDNTLWIGGSFNRASQSSSPYIARYRASPAPLFATHPESILVQPGQPAIFEAHPADAVNVQLRWRRNGRVLVDGQPLPGGGIPSGVSTNTLQLDNTGNADEGTYDCIVTNACGTSHSNSAYLTVGCPADLDNGTNTGTTDGAVTIDDMTYFLAAFEFGGLAADLDNDGDSVVGVPDAAVTVDDLLFFLARFELGC